MGMTAIIGIMVITAFIGYSLWETVTKAALSKKTQQSYVWAVLVIGFIIRLMAAAGYKGHETDMSCFIGWADLAFGNGISQFYLSEGFHDYPPGYVYILYVLGAVKSVLNLDGAPLWMLIKLPAILSDLAIGYIAYRLAVRKFSKTAASAISAFVVFNPVVILNSCIWGQVDSVLSLFCVLAIYWTSERKYAKSFLAFAAAILIKPQAVFFAPILLFGLIDEYFIGNKFNGKEFGRTMLWAFAALASIFILFMPFGNTPYQGISIILKQYIETVGQYNYMTVNAFNLYGAMGQNWTDLTPLVSVIGYGLMLGMVAVSAVVFFKSTGKQRYYLSAFILIFGIYILAPKMHERYAFPAIFMLIMLIALMPTDKNMLMYGLFSLSQFFNLAWVLFIYEQDTGRYFKSPVIVIASVINLLIFWGCIYGIFKKENKR